MVNSGFKCVPDNKACLRVLFALTGVVVLAGAYFRFKGLGASPFAIDEYYLATSVKKILEHGLPRFEGGGFYVRGLALQYMAAPLFLSGLSHEFAFRLITVLFNLAALPAVFLLARHVAGVTAGCVALMLFSLSVWEVEFARFVRMYAPFATLFLWHLYFLYRRIVLDDSRATKWLYFLTLIANVFSEAAIFLVLLNFLPLVLDQMRRTSADFIAPLFLLVLTYLWKAIDFRWLGVTDHLPAEMMVEGAGGLALPIHLPPILLPEIASSPLWLIGFTVPVLVAIAAAGAWIRWAVQSDGGMRTRVLAIVPIGFVGLGLLNLFGLAIYWAVIALLLIGLSRREAIELARRRPVMFAGLSVAVSLVYWCGYVAATDKWRDYSPISTGTTVKDAVLLLFNYPDVFREVLVPWRAAMPLELAIIATLLITGAWISSSGERSGKNGYLLLTGITFAMFVLVPVFTTPYTTTRYTFFLYPVLLLLAATTTVYLGNKLFRSASAAASASVILSFGLMWCSEDFNARHLFEIDTERVTYRMGYSSGKVDLYYTRWDFRGPAAFVNAQLAPGDIVISTEYSIPYYLMRMDYLYMDQDGGRFEIIAGQQGTRDIWEGAKLLRTEVQLFQTIRDATTTVWLIAKSDKYAYQTAGEKSATSLLGSYRVYRSVDGHLDVYKIPSATILNSPQVGGRAGL